MPQQTPAPAQAPATAAPGQTGATAAPTAVPSPISREQAEFLRARRSSLSSQLESAQERRDEVASALRSDETQASERPGLEKRLEVLDNRLVEIEKEIALNGEQLANAPARGADRASTSTSSAPFFERVNPNLITIFSFALLMPLAIQFARRTFGPRSARFDKQAQADAAAMRERMDRMDSALEAVAIEVERIGESQRFLTQAMTAPGGRAEAAAPVALGAGAAPFEGVRARERDAAELR
jgi:hypothetical protein